MRNFAIASGVLAVLAASMAQGGALLSDHARHETMAAESATPLEQAALELGLSYGYTRVADRSKGALDNSWTRVDAEKAIMEEYTLSFKYGMGGESSLALDLGYSDIRDDSHPFDERRESGLDHLDLSIKWRFFHDRAAGMGLAYIPELSVPLGSKAREGNLGPARAFWTLAHRLAGTQDFQAFKMDLTLNADIGYVMPVKGTRRHYSRRFGRPVDRTNGVLDAGVAVAWHAHERIRPEIGMGYAHEFVGGGESDSDTLDIAVGAVVPITESLRARLGFREVITGRNALRWRTLFAGVAAQF